MVSSPIDFYSAAAYFFNRSAICEKLERTILFFFFFVFRRRYNVYTCSTHGFFFSLTTVRRSVENSLTSSGRHTHLNTPIRAWGISEGPLGLGVYVRSTVLKADIEMGSRRNIWKVFAEIISMNIIAFKNMLMWSSWALVYIYFFGAVSVGGARPGTPLERYVNILIILYAMLRRRSCCDRI